MFLFSWFGKLGKLIWTGLKHAEKLGLNDKTMKLALEVVKTAASTSKSNDEKREWAVKVLTTAGIPEILARLSVELAVLAFKAGKK